MLRVISRSANDTSWRDTVLPNRRTGLLSVVLPLANSSFLGSIIILLLEMEALSRLSEHAIRLRSDST